MDSYIIRVYRRDEPQRDGILGVLERTRDGTRKSFRSRDELWNLLADEPPREIKQKQGPD